jgi:peptidoglycan/xylan/chitin deacetylase (PgdA/CDA1 family)
VFIPVRPGAAQTRMAIPNANAGYNPTTTVTFDDCGEPANIGGIVDALARSHRQALFFVTGQCRDRYPWLVGELKAAGHQVCNHTYSHPDLRRLGDAAIRAEIGGGVLAGCPYFRPPYGAWDGPRGRIARIAAEFGLTVMLWDVDTRDWADADPAAMVALIKARGGVVLFHLHGRRTLEALTALDA